MLEQAINEGYFLHLACGFIISLTMGMCWKPLVILGFVAGYLKEVYDYYDYGRFDQPDMYITFIGALCGTICVLVLADKFKRYMDCRCGIY